MNKQKDNEVSKKNSNVNTNSQISQSDYEDNARIALPDGSKDIDKGADELLSQ